MTRFGERIRRRRKELDLCLRETARMLNVSATELSRLEYGDRKGIPTDAVVRAMAELFGEQLEVLKDEASRIDTEVEEYQRTAPPLTMPDIVCTSRGCFVGSRLSS